MCVYLSTIIMITQLTNNSEPEWRFLNYLTIVSIHASFHTWFELLQNANISWQMQQKDIFTLFLSVHKHLHIFNNYWLFSNLDFYAMILFTAQNLKDFLHMYFWLLRDNLYVTGYGIVEAIKQERKIYPKNIIYHEVAYKEKPFSYLNHTFCLKSVMIVLKCIFFT